MSDIQMDTVYTKSNEIVARDIEGELIIIPLTSGFGDMEDELYTLNATGRAMWKLLDGHRDLKSIVVALEDEYDAPDGDIELDVVGLVTELVNRKILVQTSNV